VQTRPVTAAQVSTESSTAPDWGLTDAELRAAGSVKWTWDGPDVLPAWVAEMDVRPAPVVLDAVLDAVRRGMFGYPPRDDVTGLPEATAAFLQRRFDLATDPDQVVLCGDVMAGVRLVLEVLCDPGPVVVPVPSYPPFLDVVPLTGRELVPVACTADAAGRPELDLDAISSALGSGARTLLLSQPHNPLGRAFTRTELEGLRDVVLAHGARVVSDEIHAPLVLAGTAHLPYAALEGTADHVTTVLAASKAWNLPGLKCAQLVAGNPADLARLRGVVHVANHGVCPLGIVASVAAYTDGEPWLEAVLAHLSAQRELFGRLLAQRLPAVSWTPMQATYLAWLDARGTGLDDPCTAALETGRVRVQPGALFGAGYAGFARVNLATSPARLEQIVDRLAVAWRP
jgi:cysteine-S-conjugate beta-lyase